MCVCVYAYACVIYTCGYVVWLSYVCACLHRVWIVCGYTDTDTYSCTMFT